MDSCKMNIPNKGKFTIRKWQMQNLSLSPLYGFDKKLTTNLDSNLKR